jgi:hypothetical protein
MVISYVGASSRVVKAFEGWFMAASINAAVRIIVRVWGVPRPNPKTD